MRVGAVGGLQSLSVTVKTSMLFVLHLNTKNENEFDRIQ